MVFQYGGMLSEEIRQPYLGFYKALYGIEAFNPLWVRCVGSTTFHMNAAVTALYVKKYLPDKDLDEVRQRILTGCSAEPSSHDREYKVVCVFFLLLFVL